MVRFKGAVRVNRASHAGVHGALQGNWEIERQDRRGHRELPTSKNLTSRSCLMTAS